MKLSDYDYRLPKHMIAQEPVSVRDESNLLVYDLPLDSIQHQKFNQVSELFRKGDTIVLNDTRVVNARLFGTKPTGGKIELLLLNPFQNEGYGDHNGCVFECLVKGKVHPGLNIELKTKAGNAGVLKAKVHDQLSGGRYSIEFLSDLSLTELLSNHGHVPLPPYIHKELHSPERYQTVYSRANGSVAAPTAGLHFTPELLASLKVKGVNIAYVTLHVSYGTFIPVRTEDVTEHRMDKEYVILTKENAELINTARSSSTARLIAVGTTTVRTLETVALHNVKAKNELLITPWEGWSELFIYPGFEFKAGIDILLTNFHLPKSTLLMLVSAFAGREKIFKAYNEAISNDYRFYSFGDAMMLMK